MKKWTILLTILLIGLIVAQAQALGTYWQGGTGNWGTGGNWDNGEPASDDNAYINAGTAQITQAGEVCLFLFLGENAGQNGNTELSGTAQFLSYSEIIGTRGSGNFT